LRAKGFDNFGGVTDASDRDYSGQTAVLENPHTGERFNLDLICRMTEEQFDRDARRRALMLKLLALEDPVFPLIIEFTVWEGHLTMRSPAPDAFYVPLDTALAVGQPFVAKQICAALEVVSRAIAVAHDRGIFHGALDGKHILLSPKEASPIVVGLGAAQLRFDPHELSKEKDVLSLEAAMARARQTRAFH
jgi:hypothetical protein